MAVPSLTETSHGDLLEGRIEVGRICCLAILRRPRMSGLGHKRKSSVGPGMSVVGGKAEVDFGPLEVRL